MHNIIIAIDPSGNFEEGKGTTAIVYGDAEGKQVKTSVVDAREYKSQVQYWSIIKALLKGYISLDSDCVVVIEDYLLYASKANQQINSKLETPQLIGILKDVCYSNNVPFVMQRAVDVKNRWKDEILEAEGFIHKVKDIKSYEHCHGKSGYALAGQTDRLTSHELDALRHYVHYRIFKNK